MITDKEQGVKTMPNDITGRCEPCPYRHENGNCLPVGGFCTSVLDKYCPKIKKGKKVL